MSFDFLNTFATEFGEKLKIEKDSKKEEVKSDLMEIDETYQIPLKEKKVNEVVSQSRDIRFDHSYEAIVKSGIHKGRLVEVRYFLPSSYEIEIGINYDIDSNRKLEKGQVIDNCVVLAEIGVNKYLTHCKKIIFFDSNDVKHVNDNVMLIQRGTYKGAMGRFVKYNEIKVGALLNNNPMVLPISNLFFKDLLLKNGNYFQVNKVVLENEKYYVFYGFESNNQNELSIKQDDISEILLGFRLYEGSGPVVDEIREDKTYDYSSTIDTIDQDETDETDDEEEDLSELEELSDISTNEEEQPEMRSAFSDKMRLYEQKSLTKKGGMYYDIIKKILDIKNIGIDDIGNLYDLVKEVETVVDKLTEHLKILGENFNISTSLIDIRMIIACMVAYKIVGNGLDLGGFKIYIKELYENNIFIGNVMNSVLLNAPEVFNCTNLRKTKIELEKITMLMECFDKELQNLLSLSIKFHEVRPIDMGELIPIQRKPLAYSKRQFSTIEDVKRGKIPIGAKKMVWSGKQMMKIKRIKEKLSKGGDLDKYIYENIENSPILLKSARENMVQLLFSKYENDFIDEYNKCNEEKCKDKVIKQYLEGIKGKNEDVKKYLKLVDVVFEIMNDTSETDISTNEENIRKRLQSLGIDNSNLIKKK